MTDIPHASFYSDQKSITKQIGAAVRIKKLRLKNGYKRFHDLTIDLGDSPARIVALVGPNGCGKSSVLDGMLFLQNTHRRIGSSSSRGVSYHSMNSDRIVTHDDIEITFTEGQFINILEKKRAAGQEKTIFSFRSPYRYNNSVQIKEIKATIEINQNSYGASDASSLDSKMEDNYRRLHAMVNDYMQKEDVAPSEARAHVIGGLNISIKNCLELEISNVGNVEADQGTLYFRKVDHPTDFGFDVLSSGEKEVIDLLLDLYLRKKAYDDSVFLLDEPELHINTAIQGKLLTEIDRLIGANCQIWITTHSIGFLRALQSQMREKCQIVQFRSDMNLASQVSTLKPMKATPTAWRELFSVALDDLANLVSPKTIIYCEGKDRPGASGAERGMDAKVFNNIFAETCPDVLFVSSGGNTELDQRSGVAIAILGKVFPDVEILVFKDRDMASGKDTDESDRQVYLEANPKNHRVMKRFEIENYLYDKEVLKAFCSSRNLTFDDAGYDEFVTNIVNQNLKDDTNRIKNLCGIKGSISPDSFKILLSESITSNMGVFEELRACIFERA